MPFNPKELRLDKDVPWQPLMQTGAGGFDAIAHELRGRFPQGLKAVVFAPSPHPGWLPLRLTDGDTAILVGLLLPAVQKIRDVPRKLLLGAPLALLAGQIGTALAPVESMALTVRGISWLR